MADVITVAVPTLPEASAITGDELLPVHQNGRMVRIPQRLLRGPKLFTGAGAPPVDAAIVNGTVAIAGDRWRNTATGDEFQLLTVRPTVWTFDGNVKGPIGIGEQGLASTVPGPIGATGLNAYEVWRAAGNTGSISDYIASLKGAKGDPGAGTAIRGTVANYAALPTDSRPMGDVYLMQSAGTDPQGQAYQPGDGYVYKGGTLPWQYIGPIRGPRGDPALVNGVAPNGAGQILLKPSDIIKPTDAVPGNASGMTVVTQTVPAGQPVGDFLNKPAFASSVSGPLNVMSETDAPVNVNVGSPSSTDPNIKSRQYASRATPSGTQASPRVYAFHTDHIFIDCAGSGKNGPAYADYGGGIATVKRGWPVPNNAVPGEIDTLYLFGRQTGPTPPFNLTDAQADLLASDYNAIQSNIQMSGDCGFLAFAEGVVTRIDPSNSYALTHALRFQFGVMDAFGKNAEQGAARYSKLNRLTFGLGLIADTGSLDRALFLLNNTASFEDFLYGATGATPSIRIKGADGRIRWGTNASGMAIGGAGTSIPIYNPAGTAVAYFYNDGTFSTVGPVLAAAVSASGAITSGGPLSGTLITTAAAPTASDIAVNKWSVVKRTDTGAVMLYANLGSGTLRSVTLT